jgi:hypothetical protein
VESNTTSEGGRKSRAVDAPMIQLVKGNAPAGTVSPHGIKIDGEVWKFRRVPAPLYDCDGKEVMFDWDWENNEFVISEDCSDASIFVFAEWSLPNSVFSSVELILIDSMPDRFAGFPRAADLRPSRQKVRTTAAAVGPSPAA